MWKLLAILALTAGCALQAPETSPGGVVELARFTGEIDMDAGTFVIRADPGSPQGGSRTGLTITEGPGTVSLGNGSTPTRTSGCGAEMLTTSVVLTLNYPSPVFLGGLYAEITDVSATGAEACNSAAAPTGLSAAKGLWSFGSVRQSVKTSSATWNFVFASGQKGTFSGRIVGIRGDSFTTLPAPYSNDSPTVAYARNRMVYATTASANLIFVGLDGSNLSTPAAIPVAASSVAAYVAPSAADDLVWFTTNPNGSSDEFVGVVKSDGTVISTDGAPGVGFAPGLGSIVVDPTTANRAWYRSSNARWVRSVTFDPSGGTFALGTTISVSNSNALAFGPTPNRYLFVTSYADNRIYAYSAADLSLKSTITPSAACTGPQQIVLGPDDKLWFGQWSAGNGGFCNMDAAGTTFAKVTTTPNPRGLTVGKAVSGTGDSVWAVDYSTRTATELVEGAAALYTVVVPSGTDVRPIGASPAVTSPVEYPPFLWVVTNAGLERLQPY